MRQHFPQIGKSILSLKGRHDLSKGCGYPVLLKVTVKLYGDTALSKPEGGFLQAALEFNSPKGRTPGMRKILRGYGYDQALLAFSPALSW